MSWLVGRTAWAGVFVILLSGLLPTVAPAFSVTADSQGNRVYLIIWHRDVNFPLEAISIQITSSPAELSSVSPNHTPATIPPNSGRVGGLEFDVALGAVLGNLSDLVVTVQGTVDGKVVMVPINVPLQVSASAPLLQGTIGDPSLVPGLETLDTDGDGTPDLDEILEGRDPFVVDPPMVPTIPPLGLVLLALLMLGTAVARFGRLREAP